MKYKYIFIISFIIISCAHENVKNVITYKYGIAVIDGRAAFIDVKKMHEIMPGMMVASEKHIKLYKGRIVKSGKLIWNEEYSCLSVYDTKEDDPYWRINESEIKYLYNIKKNIMYLSLDGNEWDRLYIDIVDEHPKQVDAGVYTVPIYMIIHLKCKWFEGEYEMIGTQG